MREKIKKTTTTTTTQRTEKLYSRLERPVQNKGYIFISVWFEIYDWAKPRDHLIFSSKNNVVNKQLY